jgi:hypothetical protein
MERRIGACIGELFINSALIFMSVYAPTLLK